MAPFTFPDPSVQTSVTNPETGDLWIFHDGVWMIDDHHDDSHHNHHSGQGGHSHSDALITQLQKDIEALRNDIIELKTQLDAASVNNFLILE